MEIYNTILMIILLYLMIGVLVFIASLLSNLEDFIKGEISYKEFYCYLKDAYTIIFEWPYVLIAKII